MITTRRSDGVQTTENARGSVGLLERSVINERTEVPSREESREEAKARMQRNLDRLLNYDRYSEMEAEEKSAVMEDAQSAETVAQETAYSDEDIRPTTTTTQFIDGDPQVFNDAEKSKEERKEGYKLNGKGKLVVVLYALVVTVVLALIVLNTGVLKTLSRENAALAATYSERIAAVAERRAVIEEISSPEHIIEIAENELGMVLR